jgi:inner membrane protein
MMFKTHIVFAFLVGLFAVKFFNPSNQILFIVLVMLGGLLPDIDHPKSKIGRYFRPINYLFEHRGFFHSFLFIPVLVLIILLAIKLPNFSLPLAIGYASHLVSDMLTVEGIMPLHPITRFRLRGFIRTGSFFETIILVSLIILSGYFLVHM